MNWNQLSTCEKKWKQIYAKFFLIDQYQASNQKKEVNKMMNYLKQYI